MEITVHIRTGTQVDLDFVSADVGVVFGGMGVLRTVDGGATWKASRSHVHNTGDEAMQVEFKDAFTGWIHGYNDDEFITRDGGVTWTKQYTKYAYRDRYGASIKKPYIRNSFWREGSSVGWRIDNKGGIYFSVDGGARWYASAADSFTLDDLSDVSFESSTTGFAVTSREAESGRPATRVVAGHFVRVTRRSTTRGQPSARARHQGAWRSRFRRGSGLVPVARCCLSHLGQW